MARVLEAQPPAGFRGRVRSSPGNFQQIEAILKHFPDTWSK